MTNYYFSIIYIVPLISIDGQASPRLFIAPEIRHEKSPICLNVLSVCCVNAPAEQRMSTTYFLICLILYSPILPVAKEVTDDKEGTLRVIFCYKLFISGCVTNVH